MRLATLMIACALLSLNSVDAQLPELTSSDASIPIKLQKLDVSVRMIGTRSSTTLSMTFHNDGNKVLEGTFVLPLPEGASVTRYALDINGKMREGVPVEKAKATEVFETVEKRRIDPGLLEKTDGNVFRTRIYPIPAHGVRSIIIAYEQDLVFNKRNELRYYLPLETKEVLESFSLNIDVAQKDHMPVLQSSPVRNLTFTLQKGHYSASEQQENIVLDRPLEVLIPKHKEAEQFVQIKNGEHYFYLQTFLSASTKDKKLPGKLSLIWDNSLSGLYRNTSMEIKLLEAYLKQLGTAKIQLYTLNNSFKAAGVYEVQNGSAKALIDQLKNMMYDGGTDYSRIRFVDSDETLLFTDGLGTLSDANNLLAPHIVYTITSSSKANYSWLRSTAAQNGGTFINLSTRSIKEAVNGLTKQPLVFLGIRKNSGVAEYYPSCIMAIQNGFSMAGKLVDAPAEVTLQFGYGKAVAFEKTIQLQYDEFEVEEWDLGKLFAQKKILELEMDYNRNKEEILSIGKQYSIVTQNTSLLVLENVMDYVRNEIEPPLELRSEYKRLLRERREDLVRNQQSTLSSAIRYSNSLWNWYNTTFASQKKPASLSVEYDTLSHPVADTAVVTRAEEEILVANAPPSQQETHSVQASRINDTIITRDVAIDQALQGKVAGVALNDVVVVGYGTQRRSARVGAVAMSDVAQQQVGEMGNRAAQIKVYEKSSSASYLKVLSKVPREQQYKTYLELRDQNLTNPTFYFDMANFFLKQEKALGLQILTNLAELDFQNHELLKLLGFKLKETGAYDLQEYVFRKILQWRPQEPQSYRDYALALADKDAYQAALDTLYLALTKEYNSNVMSNYNGIEETIIMEMNHLISRYNASLNTSTINKALIHHMPVDIRVVLNWNMNDVDIDLWVTDPSGEKCLYSNKQTKHGGRISDDFTNGYGPEQFLLKNAMPGKYKIQVHYYGERMVKVAGKTTLLAEVFTNYGRSAEERKVITLQLQGEEKEGVYVGEFVF